MSASRRVSFAVGVAMIVGAACSGTDDRAVDLPDRDDGVRIASFDFGESAVLAEVYAQAVEAAGVPVVRAGAIGPREIALPALELGQVDVVPEYLGTASRWYGATEPAADTDAAFAALVPELERLGLTALDAAPAEDENVIVVTAAMAERAQLAKVSDLAALAPQLRFGGPPECPDRPLCLIGLQDVYGLEFGEFVVQRSQRFTAEALRRGEIDVGLMFSTDPAVTARDLAVLDDDRRLQPAENVVPIVRTDAIERWGPALVVALDRVSAALTTSTLRLLNRRAGGGDVERVARDWLRAAGVIESG